MSIHPRNSSQRILILYPGDPVHVKIPSNAITPVPTGSGSGSNAVSKLLNILTGTSPPQDVNNLAGYTSHVPLRLTTKYYDAQVSIWCDELPNETSSVRQDSKSDHDDEHDKTNATTSTSETTTTTIQLTPSNSNQDETTLSTWLDQMCSSEAKEVRAVIGALVLVLPYKQSANSSTQLQSSLTERWIPHVQSLSTLRDQIEDETGRDLASLVVLIDQTAEVSSKQSSKQSLTFLEHFEDETLSERGILGWDFVQIDEEHSDEGTNREKETKRNAYGEKIGMDRVMEVLQAIDWSASIEGDSEDGNEGSAEREMDLSFLDDLNSSSFMTFQPRNEGDFPQSEQEFQREMLELKIAMLNTGGDEVDDNSFSRGTTGEDFGGFSSTFDTGSGNVSKDDDDVWAALDNRDRDGGQDALVDNLPSLLERVAAIREAGAEMSSSEREKFAKKEIGRLMKEL